MEKWKETTITKQNLSIRHLIFFTAKLLHGQLVMWQNNLQQVFASKVFEANMSKAKMPTTKIPDMVGPYLWDNKINIYKSKKIVYTDRK